MQKIQKQISVTGMTGMSFANEGLITGVVIGIDTGIDAGLDLGLTRPVALTSRCSS